MTADKYDTMRGIIRACGPLVTYEGAIEYYEKSARKSRLPFSKRQFSQVKRRVLRGQGRRILGGPESTPRAESYWRRFLRREKGGRHEP